MKIFNMLAVAALSILTTAVFAQNSNTTNKAVPSTKSKKEQMKMQVMKVSNTPKEHSNIAYVPASDAKGVVVNRSAKEQMKKSLMKVGNTIPAHDLVIDKSGNCTDNITYANLSQKEQMKLKVMNLNTCAMQGNVAGDQPVKCTICGKDLSAVKK